jgi:hypothetical protein
MARWQGTVEGRSEWYWYLDAGATLEIATTDDTVTEALLQRLDAAGMNMLHPDEAGVPRRWGYGHFEVGVAP